MSRSVAEAALGSTQIAENIGGVAAAAATTTAGVGDGQQAAGEVALMSDTLQRLVAQFTV
jgi:methyl-accepting chemotaxis protein